MVSKRGGYMIFLVKYRPFCVPVAGGPEQPGGGGGGGPCPMRRAPAPPAGGSQVHVRLCDRAPYTRLQWLHHGELSSPPWTEAIFSSNFRGNCTIICLGLLSSNLLALMQYMCLIFFGSKDSFYCLIFSTIIFGNSRAFLSSFNKYLF